MIKTGDYQFWLEALQIVFLAKIILAMILGGIVGSERGRRKKPAGLRTHMLVASGACMYMEMSSHIQTIYPAFTAMDPSRVLAQIVVGISFIGAGTVIRAGDRVKGLTTAATIWVTAAVGTAVAAGMFIEAVYLTILTFLILRFAHRDTPNHEEESI